MAISSGIGTSFRHIARASRGSHITTIPFSSQRASFASPAGQRRNTPSSTSRDSDKLAQFTRDEQIDTEMVQVKTDDGALAEPLSLRQILRDVDRNSHCVVQLSKPGERDFAVVQIRAKMDLLKQLRDKENQVRQQELVKRDLKPKQIELNWAISENDLSLKLKQMERFLEKGKTVEILLAAKKRQRKATMEEGTAVMRRIQQALQEIDAKETKPMQGQILKQAILVVKK